MDMRLGEGTGSVKPWDPVPRTGDPTCCRGEAALSLSAKYPGSTNITSGNGGGLVGAIPEALCGEAPKGQPMTRGENLEAVSVEAPKGQPKKH